MTTHQVASREEWLDRRRDLLAAEKALTRQSDQVAELRQRLPWVRIDTTYTFDTEDGEAGLPDLFRGRSQLLIYHFMFGPDYKAGCPSCSAIADGFDGIAVHLANHDVMLWAVSRAPLDRLLGFRRKMGWSFPWASSAGSTFNTDFAVALTPEQQRAGGFEYNYRREPPMPELAAEPLAGSIVQTWKLRGEEGPVAQIAASTGTDVATYTRDRPGISAFVLEDGAVYHTYSSYARGLDSLWGMYQWLDRAPKGRNEDGIWWRRLDEYPAS